MNLLQLHPTTRCNYDCSYCSYRDENKNIDLDANVAVRYIRDAHELGCKQLKITGGGEPLMHKLILNIILTAKFYGMKIYLQTNGSLLDRIHRKFIDDIRVSYGDGITFKPNKDIRVDGYSYIVTSSPDYDNLNSLLQYAIANNQYVRITQDDTDIDSVPDIGDIQVNIQEPVNGLVTFWDIRNYHKGKKECPSLSSPVVGADGYIYPCCRTQYAEEPTWGYNKMMRIGQDLKNLHFDGRKCKRCYYK